MSALPVSVESIAIQTGGQSQQVAVTTSSAQSSAITNSKTLVVCSTVTCFLRQGSNPTALSTGVDQYLPANVSVRLTGFISGNKIAVIGTGSGTLYITPET